MNQSTFAKVIVKIKVARFLWPTVYYKLYGDPLTCASRRRCWNGDETMQL